MKPIVAAFVLAVLAAARADAEEHDQADEHAAVAHGLRVLHPWTRATEGGDVLVWFEIENQGDAEVTLTGGSSPLAAEAEIVGFQLADGDSANVPLEEVSIDAGGEMEFEPRGLALRLGDVTGPLEEGDTFPLELQTSAGPLPMTVLVESSTAEQHSHAGHAH